MIITLSACDKIIFNQSINQSISRSKELVEGQKSSVTFVRKSVMFQKTNCANDKWY